MTTQAQVLRKHDRHRRVERSRRIPSALARNENSTVRLSRTRTSCYARTVSPERRSSSVRYAWKSLFPVSTASRASAGAFCALPQQPGRVLRLQLHPGGSRHAIERSAFFPGTSTKENETKRTEESREEDDSWIGSKISSANCVAVGRLQ